MDLGSLIQDIRARLYLDDVTRTFSSLLSFVKCSLSRLPLPQLIRLAWIIGGYILFRPYLEFGLRKLFTTEEEDSSDTIEASPAKGKAAGGILEESETRSMSTGFASASTSWGAAARKRQAMVLQAWQEEQSRLAEEQDFDGIDSDLLEE